MRQKWIIGTAALTVGLLVAVFWFAGVTPAAEVAALRATIAAPASFSATATAGAKTDTVTLTWVPPAGASGYTIQSADFTSGVKTYSVASTAKSFTTPALPKGNTYYFRLRASTRTGTSVWSPIVTVTTP
jgi:hypothetical protein